MADEVKFNNPFAALGALKDKLPAQPAPAPPAPSAPDGAPGLKTRGLQKPTGKTYARAVVRLERAGRSGKDVTIIEHLDLPASDREKWLKALKAALGCGGVVEDGSIVLQGDHRTRLREILVARGVKKVTVSN